MNSENVAFETQFTVQFHEKVVFCSCDQDSNYKLIVHSQIFPEQMSASLVNVSLIG